MSDLYKISTSHYNLGRLSLVVPKELQPQIKEFYYIWDSRSNERKDLAFGYPISLQELPLDKYNNQQEQWINIITNMKQKYRRKILFEWDLKSLFSRNAYFMCIKKWSGEYDFIIMVQETKCILNYIHSAILLPNEMPKKDTATDNMIKNIFNFYKKYRFGHTITSGNVFFTYFGEILDNIFNNNEKMLLMYNNTKGSKLTLDTNINPIGDSEDKLREWMVKNRELNLYSSRMIKLQNFPGNAYEIITKESNEYIVFELYYNGPHRSTNIPSFQIDFVIQSKYNLQSCLDYWKIIIRNISPLQTKNFVG